MIAKDIQYCAHILCYIIYAYNYFLRSSILLNQIFYHKMTNQSWHIYNNESNLYIRKILNLIYYFPRNSYFIDHFYFFTKSRHADHN